MNRKKIRYLILLSAILILVFGIGWKYGQYRQSISNVPSLSIAQNLTQSSLFNEVFSALEDSYLEKEKLTDQTELIYGAIQGMVASLDDPYTIFLKPEENKEFRENLAGSFGGVGIQLGYKNKQLAVIAPLEGTPAQKAGVKAGDIIVHVKDQKKNIDQGTLGITLPKAVNLIRGEKGTPVELTLFREGEENPIKIAIVRQEIKIPSVELKIVESNGKKIAHLKLIRFGDNTNREWNQAVTKILNLEQSDNFEGVVLDVRNNPGGYLSSAVYIASEFIGQGVVVQQEEKGNKKMLNVSRSGKLIQVPLVVLVNQGSASASEIVAGALKAQKGTKIIGKTTFGKGTIQESRELSDGAGIHITTARWLLPDGESIHQKGITPDIEIDNNPQDETEDLQLNKAVEELIK